MTGLEAALAVGLGVVIPAWYGVIKHIYTKLASLDVRLRESVSEQEVRQLIDDKINPIRDDIQEIKQSINKLVDHMIEEQMRKKY